MKLFLKILGVCLAFLAQSIVFENIKIFSASADILIVAIVIAAVSANTLSAALIGGIAGLLKDVICTGIFGVNILLYMYLAIIVSMVVNERTHNSPLLMSLVTFTAVTAYEIVLTMFKAMFGYDVSFSFLGSNILVNGIFGAIFALLFVLVYQKITTRHSGKQIPDREDN